jgi:hypothetical protein
MYYNVEADINKWGDIQIDLYKIVRSTHYKPERILLFFVRTFNICFSLKVLGFDLYV